ncbi:uncharacterized protein Z518_10222 [Rhinocladiella mackenziei CBS 650.93]|uniref:Rhinocladiella mackenziei CBS 650.93 unplaced genomic scaffold supercont1.9, whole genome shotgun sequence n=1 Tax=Rhinocladiella mackenziei CBS 650.93 TaxID=1442369 RepID=A0A0D2ITN8_9EURO|nr:uncharacterized protein Z518_10222 [Rhinocladiella mackenziei CBS 650.93]KIX00085.1 hypothetical protein Z518_10222 [Rhinocladiella mackenziei CBS 650.93]
MATNVVRCAHQAEAGQHPNRKRLILCCDGTWNNSNDKADPASNVSRLSGAFARKCCSGMPQIVYYHPGAGTEVFNTAKVLGGMFGAGIPQDIVESYRFICDNYRPGDEIVIIGFSRGAFTARSVAGMVCALGFLNRAGIDQLPHIFRDYKNWLTWTRESRYNKKDQLLGFTLDNLRRVKKMQEFRIEKGSKEDVEITQEALDAEKKKLFEEMSKIQDSDPGRRTRTMAEKYRDMLVRHEMSLATRTNDQDGNAVFVAVEGMVRAIGVWDTVGSLGIPKLPLFHNGDPRTGEIRFESLNVHPNIDYAFHAIALDEWRTAFSPTMWDKREDNENTKLRQVWFPGSHGNVGGGWQDQQIATIALAWMADQLTSIGVEFSRTEMFRIFYSVNPGVEVRKWGMGRIYHPTGVTTIPDKFHRWATLPYRKITGADTGFTTRTPGMYNADGKNDKSLNAPEEYVHPSVRIRYQYYGRHLDDVNVWDCRALIGNGYKLKKGPLPNMSRPGHVADAFDIYHSVGGPVTPFYNFPTSVATTPLVRVEGPRKNHVWSLDEPSNQWFWEKGENKLLEECIGIWERMFIRANCLLLQKQQKDLAAGQEDGRAEEDVQTRQHSDSYITTYGYHDIIPWQEPYATT